MNNNIFFILSHQDDEFGLFNVIEQATQKKQNVFVIYLTSGHRTKKENKKYKLQKRDKESLNTLLKLGVIKKITKKNKTFEYVGCTPSELKSHLEKQFHNNPETNEPMTWMNWTLDGWHIDHRDPLDLAKNEEDAKRLCHYTNLQTMWAKENLKKGSKIKN
jgi:hypothetical protein